MGNSDNFYDNSKETRLQIKLYEQVAAGKLRTFSDLKDAVKSFAVTNTLRKCVFKAFDLQRKLYWGFFSDLSSKKYPDIWREIVIADKDFRFAGDLKQMMSIPSVYLGLLDIHGYTKFCSDKRRNMSMIDLLDRMIHEDVKKICVDSGVISKRARGDEILLLGASADAVLCTVLDIMEYFATQGRSLKNTVLRKRLPGTVLPKFQISAGIAGGQKFTPLVITRDGDISGDIVNTAARLQALANKISPDKNRIMITKPVYQKLVSSKKSSREESLAGIDFLDIGKIEFKGKSLTVYDIIFLPADEHRLDLRKNLEDLISALDKQQWKAPILKRALDLSQASALTCLKKGCPDNAYGQKAEKTLKESLDLIRKTHVLLSGSYFDAAVSTFSTAVEQLDESGQIDRIILEYLELVKRCYNELTTEYGLELEREVSLRLNDLYSPDEKQNYLMLKNESAKYEKLKSASRLKIKNRSAIWQRIVDLNSAGLDTILRSAK